LKTKAQLKKRLEELKEIAHFQHDADVRSQIYLHKGLAGLYMWWRDAKEHKNYLEELYKENDITIRKTDGVEKFTGVLRLVWNLDWDKSNKASLQMWSLALREIHKEYESNSNAYKTNAEREIVNYIKYKGGINLLIGTDRYYKSLLEFEKPPKNERRLAQDEEDKKRIDLKHLELGELYFEKEATPISKVQITKPFAVNRKGYALALVRKNSQNKFDILSTYNNQKEIENAIIETYKRNNKNVPTVLRLLTEIINTQSLPLALESDRKTYGDATSEVFFDTKNNVDTKVKVRQNKRLLFIKKTKEIIFSENRTSCSVVTTVKPKQYPLLAKGDTFLTVNDKNYLERAIIQNRNVSLYTTNDKIKIPLVRSDISASHRLILKNTETHKERAIYFYDLQNIGEKSRIQAIRNSDYKIKPLWEASVENDWFGNVNAIFTNSWLENYGEQLTRDNHKAIEINFGKSGVLFKYDGSVGFASKHTTIFDVVSIKPSSKPLKVFVRSKDLFPVLDGLPHIEIIGRVAITANEDVVTISYKTELASYNIAIPTCNKAIKRNTSAFVAYGG
jgi:hypothetical protein